jgi:hypothetical protein
VPPSEVKEDATVIDSTWAMKLKSDGTHRARLAGRGFWQIPGKDYDPDCLMAPVVAMLTVFITLTLIIICSWYCILIDLKGAFLTTDFEAGRNIYMKIPKGFEKFYPEGWLLKLNKTIYGTKQASRQFWIKLYKALDECGYKRSNMDQCLYYKWHEKYGLTLIISWVDDLMICGKEEACLEFKEEIKKRFEIDDIGEMREYVGCKIDRKVGEMKLTQPVIIQSLRDEFNVKEFDYKTPAAPGTSIPPCPEGLQVEKNKQSIFRRAVGKFIHIVRWTRLEVGNSVRELTRGMTKASPAHYKAMERELAHLIATPNRGRILKPRRLIDPDKLKDTELEIDGLSDADYAKDDERRRSVSGSSAIFEGVPISGKSKMQEQTALSVMESKAYAGSTTAQDMLFCAGLLESIGLKVKYPMTLRMDNKGAVDLFNNYSVGGRTRHIQARVWFMRDICEEVKIQYKWISSEENFTDIFTKNVDAATFNKHAAVFVGHDEYMDDIK